MLLSSLMIPYMKQKHASIAIYLPLLSSVDGTSSTANSVLEHVVDS